MSGAIIGPYISTLFRLPGPIVFIKDALGDRRQGLFL